MDTIAAFPLSFRPFASLAKALSDTWAKGPAPCWTEYLRATRD